MRNPKPGPGMPTDSSRLIWSGVPNGFTSWRGKEQALLSVMPYCTEKIGPRRSMARLSKGTGMGAAAVTTCSRLSRLNPSRFGVSSTAWSMAATIKVKVTFSSCTACSTASGSKPWWTTVEPPTQDAELTKPMPPIWKAGVVCSTRVAPVNPVTKAQLSAVRHIAWCVRITPFGCPVVPLVYIR
ncbi:hypothetical protein D3C78_1139590 [compost metagenome]